MFRNWVNDSDVAKYLTWHFFIDEDKIIQHLPLTEHGWHAGDGNKNCFTIKIAENKSFKKCEGNAIKLNAS